MTPTLRARIAALTGPDREVDALVWAHFNVPGARIVTDEVTCTVYAVDGHDNHTILGWVDPGEHSRNFEPRVGLGDTPVTSSLDALRALIERKLPGHKVASNEWVDGGNNYEILAPDGRVVGHEYDAPTTCAAGLLALLDAMGGVNG